MTSLNSKYIPFAEVKGNFGFGCMRLPLLEDGSVNEAEFCQMVDAFLDAGFNYFDTAHGYLEGKSELAIRECLAKRHKREEFILVNKLTSGYFKKNEDIRPFFEGQLQACGVEYFDFYLMHSQHRSIYSKYKECRAYEEAFKLKAEGKIRHVGISFHDDAQTLDMILNDYPQLEVVQIQYNYADYDNPAVQSAAVLEVCRKHNIPAIVMEPVKGGGLVKLPPLAEDVVRELGDCSAAELAIRYAAGAEGVFMTLSGMGNMDMMQENIGFMRDFKPLSARELLAIEKIKGILADKELIACTGCRYCVEGCPAGIQIPDVISYFNSKKMYPEDWNPKFYYSLKTKNGGKASSCIGCGACEGICPQHLPVRDILKAAIEVFEKKDDED